MLPFNLPLTEKYGNKLSINNKKTSHTIGKSIAGPASVDWPLKEKMRKNRQEGLNNKNDWCFYWSWDVLVKAFKAKFICVKKINENYVVYKKEYEKAKFSGRDKNIILRDYETIALRNIISDAKISSQRGNLELRSISEDFDFSYPKPTSLLKKLFSTKSKDAVILDFFAGSGTTGHAVMELNEENPDSNRRFILVNDNEIIDESNSLNGNKSIPRDIMRERLFRVINGCGSKNEKIKWVYSENRRSLSNNSVKYLKIELLDKIKGEFESIDAVKYLYKDEFDKDLSIKDFKE